MKTEIDEVLAARIDDAIDDCVDLAGQLAGQYFQEAFTKKAFDGKAWKPNSDPTRRGSELIDSGNLRRSMQTVREGRKVTVSFGNQKVGYAQVHNEGFDGQVVIPAHTRKTKRGEQNVRTHTRRMRIPQRQFLGDAKELEQLLHDELEAYINDRLNK